MTRLKVGYWPISEDLKAAGDRRRLVFWANSRGHEIVTDKDKKVDVIVASEKSDFNSPYFEYRKVPLIFDLVDAYLSPLNAMDDFARGVAKKFSGQITKGLKPFSRHVEEFCIKSDAVICSSIEQQIIARTHQKNTHVILDSHDEIPFLSPPRLLKIKPLQNSRILWEGQPATIRGVKKIYDELIETSIRHKLQFDFVTDQKYYLLLNKYFGLNTEKLLMRDLPLLTGKISVFPWSIGNLVERAKISHISMLPINLDIPMQRMKPENRLLIMWRLGLPCLTSNTPAYERVSVASGVEAVCRDNFEWINRFDKLLSDSKYARAEIEKGQDYLRSHHNANILLQRWDAVFESVIG